jgi:predicted Zn-dependent peptidase
MEIAEFIESVGGEHNAFTGKEYTGYYAKIVPKHLVEALDFLSDNLLGSRMTDEDVEHERAVIKQEINMYEDIPSEVCSNKFEEVVFGKNALGRDIIGTKETLDATSRQDILNYKEEHYFGENVVVVIAGNQADHSEESIIKLIEEYFPLRSATGAKKDALKLRLKKSFEIVKKDTAQAQIAVGFQTTSVSDKDTFTLELLSVILGGAMSSRMFQEIREKRQLAYSVRTTTSSYIESGTLVTQAGVNEGKTVEAIEAILNEYRKIKTEKVSAKELAKAREIINGKMLIKFENSEELAYHYASDETLIGKTHTPAELAAIYTSIGVDDIFNAANKYFSDDRLGLCFVGKQLDRERVRQILNM